MIIAPPEIYHSLGTFYNIQGLIKVNYTIRKLDYGIEKYGDILKLI